MFLNIIIVTDKHFAMSMYWSLQQMFSV